MPRPPSVAPEHILSPSEWEPLAHAHAQLVDAITAAHLARGQRHEPHATEDFLWDYYTYSPGQLRRWHPGLGKALTGPNAAQYLNRWYVQYQDGVGIDHHAFLEARSETVENIHALLTATEKREAQFSCFCLHEWAMVYHTPEPKLRHRLPLRLGGTATDKIVDTHAIRCSHFDAYRYFAPDASPLNSRALTRADQIDAEQPGCLHAIMDLYKWAYKLSPAVSSDLVLEAFLLASRVRELDMAASPYDASTLGLAPVAIETPEGKAEFVARQRELVELGQHLRANLIEQCALILTPPQ